MRMFRGSKQIKEIGSQLESGLHFVFKPERMRPKQLSDQEGYFQQFLVDGYTMMESERLRWLRKNQSKLRVGKYNYLTDIRTNGHTDGANTGKRVVLPSSYVGSRRYM